MSGSGPKPSPRHSPAAEAVTALEFEKPLTVIQEKIDELMLLSQENQVDFDEQIAQLRDQADEVKARLYQNLSAPQKLQIARHPQRPNFLELVQLLSPTQWIELHGDRAGSDDRAILGGIIELSGMPVMMVGTQKGRGMKENLAHNFGMASPEGYRKALRLFQHAEKFKMPVVTVIDTPGAYPGLAGEEHGIGQAIAFNIREMARLKVPILSLVTGEGCSGGALGVGVANRIYMLEHAVYTVISPEGCASILWRSAEYAARAAEALKITAQDLQTFGMIDGIIAEPMGGAHHNPAETADGIATMLLQGLSELKHMDATSLMNERYEKFRKIGAHQELSAAAQRG
ncbi:MAG: acetyl-CoA carboxylase carboxyltransferase subunit alpha [Candidatus Melainabacteria bacterium]